MSQPPGIRDFGPLEQLQHILLQEERRFSVSIQDQVSELNADVEDLKEDLANIRKRLQEVATNIENPVMLNGLVEPVVKLKIDEIKRDFPRVFGYEVKETIKKELQSSREEFVDALYPLIGRMIRRYVNYEVEAWFDRLTRRVEDTFSWRWWRNVLLGNPVHDTHFACEIEEIFIVAHGSGLLLASYSKNNTRDINMIAAMLTSIRMFAKESFELSGELNTIDYEGYKILMHDHHKSYFAIVLSGIPDQYFLSALRLQLDAFAEKNLSGNIDTDTIDNRLLEHLSANLKLDFETFTQMLYKQNR